MLPNEIPRWKDQPLFKRPDLPQSEDRNCRIEDVPNMPMNSRSRPGTQQWGRDH